MVWDKSKGWVGGGGGYVEWVGGGVCGVGGWGGGGKGWVGGWVGGGGGGVGYPPSPPTHP